jgi:uncharacterized protein YcsI (UPF0317 family)
VPGYRIYRRGELAEKRADIRDVWRDDLVAFLLGCSFTFEHALVEAGVPPRNVELGTDVSMPVSSIMCVPAGRFHGPTVVTFRPIPERKVELVRELSARTRTPTARPSTSATRRRSASPTSAGPSSATRPRPTRARSRCSGPAA